jgi:hypothetical protein
MNNSIKTILEEVIPLVAKLDNGSHSSNQLQGVDEAITDLITRTYSQAYEEGQQNPKVGFLRQYLNESSLMGWTDEHILDFLRIPFKNLPKDTVVKD